MFFLNPYAITGNTSVQVHAGGVLSYTQKISYRLEPISYFMVALVTDGEARCLINHSTQILRAGMVFILRDHISMQFQITKTPFSYCIYWISGAELERYRSKLFPHPQILTAYFSHTLPIHSILYSMRQINRLLRQMTVEEDWFVSNYMQTILTELVLQNQQSEVVEKELPRHVCQVKQIFDNDYQTSHSLDELAEQIGVNKYRLCRDFSKYMNISPLQYLNQCRMEHAKELLCSTNYNVHEIGSKVGIDNTTHFIRLFTKNVGTTPAQFRQQSIAFYNN